jgi:hypothetical protein
VSRSNPSILSLASSSKRIIQIALLLAERKMTFSFCLGETAMLHEAMVGMLFRAIALGPESALFREDWKLMMAACERLDRAGGEFRELLENLARPSLILPIDESETKVGIRFQEDPLKHEGLFNTPIPSPEPKRIGAENMGSYTAALNLDCMTFSASPIHAGRPDGSKPTNWITPFSALGQTNDFQDVKRSHPPSSTGYSSLDSSSPDLTNAIDAASMETYAAQSSATEPWSSDLAFSPYYLRQRGAGLGFNDSHDPLGTGALPPDNDFICMAPAQIQIPQPASGTAGDVELFGVDLSLI